MPDLSAADLINLKILAHPINWLVVWTVLLFGAFAWHLINARLQSLPDSAST